MKQLFLKRCYPQESNLIQGKYLYCAECGYVHPSNAGLEEGDICPDCGRGILVEF